jgi:ABC-type nickel/cobalt efflux system permease component RcnA
MVQQATEHSAHHVHQRLEDRHAEGIIRRHPAHGSLNDRLAVMITNTVGTMWCAYVFAILALISLPTAIRGGVGPIISWIAQTFLQLVLLSIIMVGQKVAARASDKQAAQTYKDAETLLSISGEVHRLVQINNQLTEEIHAVTIKK